MTNTELLIYMLEDIRKVTLKGIEGLTKEQLYSEPIKSEFPLGSYLMHLAECDLWWLSLLDGKECDEELSKRCYMNSWYDPGSDIYPLPSEPIETDEYIDVITKCRKKLIDYIKSLNDTDLEGKAYRARDVDGEKKSKEYSRKWIIYHLIEHEAHHRGQMFMLIRMAGFKKRSV